MHVQYSILGLRKVESQTLRGFGLTKKGYLLLNILVQQGQDDEDIWDLTGNRVIICQNFRTETHEYFNIFDAKITIYTQFWPFPSHLPNDVHSNADCMHRQCDCRKFYPLQLSSQVVSAKTHSVRENREKKTPDYGKNAKIARISYLHFSDTRRIFELD